MTISEIKEDIWEARGEWLRGQGSSEKEVFEDEDGEYIINEYEGEGGVIESQKQVYLPQEFQQSNMTKEAEMIMEAHRLPAHTN